MMEAYVHRRNAEVKQSLAISISLQRNGVCVALELNEKFPDKWRRKFRIRETLEQNLISSELTLN